jgi:hypothetical protein
LLKIPWLLHAATTKFSTGDQAMTPLRKRMLEDMQIRSLAQNTQESYLQQVASFARHFGKSPEALGP